MNNTKHLHEQHQAASISDASAALRGSLLGIAAGIPLGILIASLMGSLWTVTGVIVVLHAAIAMVAMGAWLAPSLLSKPVDEEEKSKALANAELVQRDLASASRSSAREVSATTAS